MNIEDIKAWLKRTATTSPGLGLNLTRTDADALMAHIDTLEDGIAKARQILLDTVDLSMVVGKGWQSKEADWQIGNAQAAIDLLDAAKEAR